MPTRLLKPGVRDSGSIDKLTPLGETFFYRLLVTVDDFGRCDARPAMIKASCFPIKEAVTPAICTDLLAELTRAELVSVYEVDGKPYLQMLKWDNIPRAKESKFPSRDGGCEHLFADAEQAKTNAPLTVTDTVTDIRIPKPITRSRAPAIDRPENVGEQIWSDWLQLRKTKKAPVTDTVIKEAIAEAGKAGLTLERFLQIWCSRGSQGLQADWLKPSERQQPKTNFHHDLSGMDYTRGVDEDGRF